MSILQTITAGKTPEGVRIVLAGLEKVGKTTLASGAPKALLVPLEIGYSGVSVQRTAMIQDFASVNSFLDEAIYYAQQGTFGFESIVFDSATALERQIHQNVIQADPGYGEGNKKAVTMETALGGYGKGYTLANSIFADFLKKCDILAVNHNINIILTCHVFAARLIDPINGEFDSWDLQLHSPKNQKTYGKREMITQWADIVGFLHEPMYVTQGTGETLVKAVSANQGRVLGMSRTPSYVAGNRYGVQTEIPIPFEGGWNHIAKAVYDGSGVDIFNRD